MSQTDSGAPDTGAPCEYYGCPYPTNPRYNHDHPPEIPDVVQRIYAFAQALGLTVDGLVALLESYDLHILGGSAPRDFARPNLEAP